ncbi:MAG TPA: hypothetical protein VFL99_14675 [Segeticoccus sp.]|uniref:hypothetical protein n=1 Tax=Segeticoccus sp. TaxID=2706531 RepID=UPI002D7FFF85|nr:hypothetical protein [Segeticoccus sp.]HET8601569.1 hypothetical protein [Segeticoccus sp.]
MFTLVIGMLVCVVIAAVVVGVVAVPARREGREVLTPHGEEVVAHVRHRTSQAADRAKERTEGALTTAKSRASEVRSRAGSDAGGNPQRHADSRH